jgi:acyl-CoA thioesterase
MDITTYLKNDTFALYTGVELLSVGDGKAAVKLLVKPHHLNAYGKLHGGALFTLADFAFAAASNSHGTVAVGINATISYLKAVTDGELLAVAEEVSLGSKLGNYIVKVYQDNEVVALFQGMVYRKKETHSG